MPVFDNSCFSSASPFFIPPFKSLRKPTSDNNEATSRGLDNEGPGEQVAHEKLRARKAALKKLADDDDVIKYDKHHAANLLSRPSPNPLVECDSTVTVVAHAQPPPPPPLSADTNPHPTPPSERTQHEHIASHTPTPTPSESNQGQQDNQANGQERRDELTQAGVEDNETGKRERVVGEVAATRGKHPPPPTALVEHNEEHDNETSACEAIHAAVLAVEPPPDDRVPGEYKPTPPPPHPQADRLANNAVPGEYHPPPSLSTPTTTHAQFTPLPPLHPGSTTAQLGRTTEEAEEAHRECTRPQRGLQEEIDRRQSEQTAEQGAHDTYPPPPEHLTHDAVNEHDTRAVLLSHQEESGGDIASQSPKRDAIGQLAHELNALREGREDWAIEMEIVLKETTQGEYRQAGYMDPTPVPPPLLPGLHHNPLHRTTHPPGPTTDPPAPNTDPDAPVSAPIPVPALTRHDTFKTCMGHVTATRPYLVTRLRPPPWPNNCRRHCQTPSHLIPYILHLRPLPWPPPPASSTVTKRNRADAILGLGKTARGHTHLSLSFYHLFLT
jgi:hypothetical protein